MRKSLLASVICMKSTSVRKNGQPSYISRSIVSFPASAAYAAKAVPAPYQDGSRKRFWVQANTQGMALRLPTVGFCTRREGLLPMLSRESSPMGDDSEKNVR